MQINGVGTMGFGGFSDKSPKIAYKSTKGRFRIPAIASQSQRQDLEKLMWLQKANPSFYELLKQREKIDIMLMEKKRGRLLAKSTAL